MSSKKSELFHSHESDALRLIKGAQLRAEEPAENVLENITKDAPQFLTKRKVGRPKLKEAEKSKKRKQCSIYLTEDEYKFFKDYAWEKRQKLNDIIVQTALEALGYKPEDD